MRDLIVKSSMYCVREVNNISSYLLIRRKHDYIQSDAYYCMLFSSSVTVRGQV